MAETGLGGQLLAWRTARGLTQAAACAEVLRATGIRITQSRWSMWESGAREADPITARGVLAALAEAEKLLQNLDTKPLYTLSRG